jgi:sulfur carrier protein
VKVNGVSREPSAVSLDVTTLLGELGVEPRGIAVAINGEIVRRSQWSSTFIGVDDHVEIVTAAAGG